MTNVKVFADKQTDRRMDGQTDGKKTICPGSIDAGITPFFFFSKSSLLLVLFLPSSSTEY